ncbi:putative 5xTM membrane YitT family protein [Aliiruegeria haliotis]|uniref:Putative 5xTM membrane YitT family protein n=1 Tax=Aliiruegeria haliotis TaxID=1280846 RepID=A0A2T0RZS5_9RHOB|nr:YitT family protein [Aliiruegeria haliotis]PRY26553.1 putative 5xTM membrane YitT family protein [Aliiruegeria haliotis]
MTESHTESPANINHSRIEDLQGLSMGVFFCGLGLVFLTHLGFLTGQTAGLALIISYLSGWSFGPVFFVINLPFYWLAWTRMGASFTFRSLCCVTALSLLVEWLPANLALAEITPWLGMVVFGALTGTGLLILFRHKGSLGGLGVTALFLQDRFGFRAGYVQLIFDAVLFTAAFFLFPASVVAYSLLGAVVLNIVIAFNHRRDRYVAT